MAGATMFAPKPEDMVGFDRRDAPQLVVFVDAEEEFRWHTYSSKAVSVGNIAAQCKAQTIMNAYGVKPTYLADYPVASQPAGFEPLQEMLAAGVCTIGAQLHPWVNPPLDETITVRHTYAGNLPAELERAKVEQLTAALTANFGTPPRVFKSGRYGAGPNTAAALIASDYWVDASVMPLADFSLEGGPDYTTVPATPYWIDPERRLLEIPTTVGLVGLMSGVGSGFVRTFLNTMSTTFKVPALLSRLGLLERIRLTPEGISLDEAKRLTMTLLQQGRRLFVVSYHSSSLLPGSTPYVTTQEDLDHFLAWLDGYFRFFFGPLNGKPTTAEDVCVAARTKLTATS